MYKYADEKYNVRYQLSFLRYYPIFGIKYFISFVLLAAVCMPLCGLDFSKVHLKGRTIKKQPFFQRGEKIEFELTLDTAGKSIPGGYFIKWKCRGDDGSEKSGASPASAPVKVTASLDRPGFIWLSAELFGPDGKAVRRKGKRGYAARVAFDGGAGVDIRDLKNNIPAPRDFKDFWQSQKKRLAASPMTVDYMKKIKWPDDTLTAYAISVSCPGGRPVTGYLLIPVNASPRSLAAVVNYPGYHVQLQRPPTSYYAKGVLYLTINAHGYDLIKAHNGKKGRAYFNEFIAGLRSNGKQYAFDPITNADPRTAYFNGMSLRVLRAIEFITSLPEWDGKNLKLDGISQGGMQAIWGAALDHRVNELSVAYPWHCNIAGKTCGRLHDGAGIPYVAGLNYYDPVHFAPYIPKSCKVNIREVGLGDYVSPPSGIMMFFNNLLTARRIFWVQGGTHGAVPPYPYQSFELK